MRASQARHAASQARHAAKPETKRKRAAHYLENKEKLLAQMRAHALLKRADAATRGEVWRKNDPRVQKNSNLLHKYGMTLAEFEALREKQDDRCALCDEPGTLSVDHCHSTKKVRALLCAGCNSALGHLETRILRVGLDKFLTYIKTGGK